MGNEQLQPDAILCDPEPICNLHLVLGIRVLTEQCASSGPHATKLRKVLYLPSQQSCKQPKQHNQLHFTLCTR